MQRRSFLSALSASTTLALLALPAARAAQAAPVVEVWKTATCGCCHDWVAHLQANGFEVRTHDVSDTAKSAQRQRLGIPARLGSCHSAQVGGYALEGHVPAADIRRLLREKPRAVGLSVPAMPIGSPGMDGPAYNGRRDPFDTLLVLADGSYQVFQAHRG